MSLKVAVDTNVWTHWISDTQKIEHQSAKEVMGFLLDIEEDTELILSDMIRLEIEYTIRNNHSKDKQEQKKRLNQLGEGIESNKVFVEKARLDDEVFSEHIRKGGDFQDDLILAQLSNSMAEFFVTADAEFRKNMDDNTVKQVLKPGSAVDTLKNQTASKSPRI